MSTSPYTVEGLLDEGPVPLRDLLPFCPPARGKKRTLRTLVGWCQEGCRGVLLEAYHDGYGWFSSKQALARFFAALARLEGAGQAPGPKAAGETAAQRKQQEVLEWFKRERQKGRRR